jgi:PAS domain S-box-containing protein
LWKIVSRRWSQEDVRWAITAVLLALAIFTLDLAVPRGIGVSGLYVTLVLLALWLRGLALALASVATVLTAVAYLAGRSFAIDPWIAAANRVFAVLAVWIVAVFVDRKKASDVSLAGSLREFQDLKFALDEAAIVARTDQRGIINYVNEKFCEISKYAPEELLGQDHRILNSGYHPKEFMRDLWTTIARGRVWRGEIRNRAKDGSFYWVDTTIVPFLTEQGKPYQYLAIRADITQRKEQEAALRRAQSLAALGEMAAVVAHEVKNPLAGIGGVVQVIRERLPEGPEREVMGEVLERVKALDTLLEELLIFARPRPPKLAEIEVLELLRRTADRLREDPSMTGVEVATRGAEVRLPGDAEQLGRVFLNLYINGAQAMERRGTLEVAVEKISDVCSITVADHGPGIPPELRETVFEPFFTTKHRGTGLGLAVAARVIRDHQGSIRAGEAPGGGAMVRVSLPLHAQDSATRGEFLAGS